MTPEVISPELRTMMRRLKLGRLLDTLPERLVLARQQQMALSLTLENGREVDVDLHPAPVTDRRANLQRQPARRRRKLREQPLAQLRQRQLHRSPPGPSSGRGPA